MDDIHPAQVAYEIILNTPLVTEMLVENLYSQFPELEQFGEQITYPIDQTRLLVIADWLQEQEHGERLSVLFQERLAEATRLLEPERREAVWRLPLRRVKPVPSSAQ